MVKKPAFTMIELIFAIVVMSIAIVSLPVMTQTADKNTEASIVQEAIFASETILNESMAYYWDENSQFDESISGDLSRVINTSGCIASTPNKRIGHVNRRCLSDLAISVSNNPTVNTLDSLENTWNNQNVILNAPSGATYKAGYYATVNVTQSNLGGLQFGNTANNADLKEIALTIRDNSANIITTLRAYSANIGDIDIAKRTLP
ncbi:type II secretion system protein [Sulfurimonas sp. C5]|uniref:type II secretion system protein n=1 Tax=Sulfurimonas sp. C5 TaxID=3036947 RepID=UPI0024556C8F|nr:type II secretion system protein [Sulfurimonas sp. C5]MDH4944563.1 type II secretion system protein [Sulfurimonas sp. C5]